MKRKFIVKDEDGLETEVEEISEQEVDPTKDEVTGLSDVEIEALRKLAAVADKLIAMIDAPEGEGEGQADLGEDDDGEQIIDTNKLGDSKAAVGQIEKKSAKTNDSVDLETEIAQAWAKHYGGNR